MNMILRCIECVFRSEENHFWTSGTESAYTSGTPEVTSSFSGVRVVRSLVVCVCFVDRSLSFYPFSLGNCVVCPSSIYRFFKLFLQFIRHDNNISTCF